MQEASNDTSAARGPYRLARGTPGWLPPFWAAAGAALIAAPGRRTTFGALAAGATALFFRDPDRRPGSGRILAPADGVIKSVDLVADGRTRVATYMSLRDVHVNRAPADGLVLAMTRRDGGYLPAFRKESERNERLSWTIDSPYGTLEVVQIAGTLARRIVPYLEPGQQATRGGRLGLIRFGSRVDVYLPAGIAAGVKAGQRVRAGVTRLDGG